jgi:hypothetical protein
MGDMKRDLHESSSAGSWRPELTYKQQGLKQRPPNGTQNATGTTRSLIRARISPQLKMRTQRVEESLQEFVTTVEQLAHCAYPALPEDHVRRQASGRRENGE